MTLSGALQIFVSGSGSYQDFLDARSAMIAGYSGKRASIPIPAPPPPVMTDMQVSALPQFSLAFASLAAGKNLCVTSANTVDSTCVAKLEAVHQARLAFQADQNVRFNFLTCMRSWAMNVNQTGDINYPFFCDSFLQAVHLAGGGVQQSTPETTIKTSGLATFIPPAPRAVVQTTGAAPVSATIHPPQSTAGPAAQPNKQNPTVEPGSVDTAQRDGSGTILSGPKKISVLEEFLGGTASSGTGAISAGVGGTSPESNAMISDVFSGMAQWLHDPAQAAKDIGPAFNALASEPNKRWFGLGILLLPALVGFTVYRMVKK